MKFKKYWKIILSLAAVLLLAVVLISNIEISTPENNVVQGSSIAKESDSLEEGNEEVLDEEELKDSPFEEAKQEQVDKNSEPAEAENKQDNSSEVKKSEASSNDAATQVATEEYTEPKSTAMVQTSAQDNKEYYSFSIDCYTVLDNMGDLKKGKEGCLGNNGLIFSGNVEGKEGESVKELLLDVCAKNNIKVSRKGDYITGINNLMEKDCGKLSGWMYSVNGVFPMKSVGAYKIKKNDVIKFRYTCKNCGADLK